VIAITGLHLLSQCRINAAVMEFVSLGLKTRQPEVLGQRFTAAGEGNWINPRFPQPIVFV